MQPVSDALAKQNQVWGEVSKYNSCHNQKIDLLQIFVDLYNKYFQTNPNLAALIDSRGGSYKGNELEHYVAPYLKETVIEAIVKTNQPKP